MPLAAADEIVAYQYTYSGWGDMLTNYNGTAITYDAIGNLTNWRNAVGLYARSSTGITTDGYVSVGGGFFFGWQQKPEDEGISITWTW